MRSFVSTYFQVNPNKLAAGLWERFVRRLPPRLLALYYIARAVYSPQFEKALRVVAEVSNDPTSRNFTGWNGMARAVVSNPEWGENVYRGLAARVKMGSRSVETSLVTEVAYLIYKRRKNGI